MLTKRLKALPLTKDVGVAATAVARSEATAAEFVAVLVIETVCAAAVARPARTTVARDSILTDNEVQSALIRKTLEGVNGFRGWRKRRLRLSWHPPWEYIHHKERHEA